MIMLLLGYGMGALVSWYIIAGLFFSQAQAIGAPDFAAGDRRLDCGVALAAGAMYASMWPVMLPIAYLITGFGQHGIWRSREVSPADAARKALLEAVFKSSQDEP